MLMCEINLAQTALAALLIAMLYSFLFGFEQRKSKLPFAISCGVLTVLSAALPIIAGMNEDSDELKEIIIMLVFIAAPCFMFRHKKKLLIPVLGLLINATLDYIIFMFTSTMKITSFYVAGIMYCCLYILLCAALWFTRNKFDSETMQGFFEGISPAFYVAIILADISAYYDVIVSRDSRYYVEGSNIVRLISTVLMVGAVFYIVFKFSDSLHKQKESEMQVDMQVRLYSEMMKKNRDIRKFRHDYKNNLFSLETFIENEKYDDAKKYIEELNGSLEKTKNKYATGNFLADAIISDKADNAAEFKIEIDFSGTIPMDGISNSDLCTILANSLDNAIRACKSIAPCRIVISSRENSKGVIIKIKNPVKEKVEIKDNKIKTTKSDKENHGIGIENIKKTAGKYGGYVELSCDDSFFEIEIGLYFENTED